MPERPNNRKLTIQLLLEHPHMKPINGMTKKFMACSFAAFLVGSLSLVPSVNAGDDAVVQTSGSVTYVSGGVGTESIDRLNALAADFNLKLVFALTSGEYVSGARVVIADAKGKTLLEATSDGPWFLAKLTPGDYRIVATLADKALNRQVSIGPGKTRTVDFRWSSAQ